MDEPDWIELCGTLMPRLYRRVSRRVGGDRSLAEDVTQEAWLRAIHTWRRDGVPNDPDAWLVTVATNLLRQHFRRQRPSMGVALDEVAAPKGAPPAEGARREASRAAALQRGLARLGPDLAALVAEHHFDAQPLAALAARRGLTERAVEGRLYRARRVLARHLRAAGFEPTELDR